jgi:predicted PurR-regulated permease PerM
MDNPRPFPRGWDLTRIVLGAMTIGGLVMASFWVVRPFLLAGIWATMIVVSTWPTLRAVQARLWGKRSLAVLVMTVVMLMLIAVPLATAVIGVAERTDEIVAWSKSAADFAMAGPPVWVRRLPLVGRKVAERWETLAAASSDDLTVQAAPYLREIARWVLGQVGTVGALLVQLLLTVIITVILYANGETAAAGVRALARRLGGPAGERATILSGARSARSPWASWLPR